jgi:hypothetical protein
VVVTATIAATAFLLGRSTSPAKPELTQHGPAAAPAAAARAAEPRPAAADPVAVEAATPAAQSNLSARNTPVPVYPARGHVQFANSPPAGAFVVLHPLQGSLPRNARPYAIVRSDGSFELSTFGKGDGAPAGEYAVTVEWRPLTGGGIDSISGRNRLPAKYARPETSGLRVNVASAANEIPTFELAD